jgi:DNA-binding response OmpR family regulator
MALIPSELPEIAFLDLMLPGLSGMELLDRIRRDYPHMVVVMMTGYSTLDNAISFLKNGAFDYLPKPFEYQELVSAARRACQIASLPTEARLSPRGDRAVPCYLLGMNSWAGRKADDAVLLGITELFGRVIGRIEGIELPLVHEEVRQGSLLARLTTEDELRHAVWAALSGRVVDVNPAVERDCDLVRRDPMGEGWLVRIVPDNLEIELTHLST